MTSQEKVGQPGTRTTAAVVGLVVGRRELAGHRGAPRVPLRIGVLALLVVGLVLPTAAYGQSREGACLPGRH
jgi:hypothetical protein